MSFELPIAPSELILNDDGSIYHLHLLPEHLAHTVIMVGDPDRVQKVSRHFDRIELQRQKREFVTHTGYLHNKRITVISTGIGTDNIDIVLNELDALANINLKTRCPHPQHQILTIIRIGTSGALQPDIEPDTLLASSLGVGFDNLCHFYHYKSNALETALSEHFGTLPNGVKPYFAEADNELLQIFAQKGFATGMTATCGGFYAPQGRQLRLPAALPTLLDQLQTFQLPNNSLRFTNFEMETAGIYVLSRLLGHRAVSLNAILANRPKGQFSTHANQTMEKLIQTTLSILSTL